MGFRAEIIADSLNEHGQRLTTFIVTFPRMVLAEFNTHRMFSRNSASSRAVPFSTMLKKVEETPFIPMKWMKDHKGMQGNEYWSNDELIQEASDVHTPAEEYFERVWLEARNEAVIKACHLSNKKLTKQIVNRLLEPFMWHTAIVTTTDYENFFNLRAHDAAEIHIQHLAYMMLEEYNSNAPKVLEAGQWHIPFGDKMDNARLDAIIKQDEIDHDDGSFMDKQMLKVKVATARCARVSYINYDGGDDYEADVKLHDRLSSMGHWSCFEHCAMAMSEKEYKGSFNANPINNTAPYALDDSALGWCGNFKGFVQYRKTFANENRSDDRVQQKSPMLDGIL